MNTTVINLKIDKRTKKEAQKVAEEFGVSLSSLIKAYLRQLIRTQKTILTTEEKPTEYMLEALRESKEDIKAGRVVSFNNLDKAIDYFEKLEVNGHRKN